jgi:hypothetical protein
MRSILEKEPHRSTYGAVVCLRGLVGYDVGLIYFSYDILGNKIDIRRSPVRSWTRAFLFSFLLPMWDGTVGPTILTSAILL